MQEELDELNYSELRHPGVGSQAFHESAGGAGVSPTPFKPASSLAPLEITDARDTEILKKNLRTVLHRSPSTCSLNGFEENLAPFRSC